MSAAPENLVAAYIERWRHAGAAERANKDSFLSELCRALDLEQPQPKTNDAERDRYVFDKKVRRAREGGSSLGKIDLYRAGCFVLEAKQIKPEKRETPAWNQAMNDAHGQALGYAKSLPEPPPFVVVCDLGYCFDLYASFDGSGAYRPFPDAFRKRLYFADLERHADALRALWLDPLSLDPSRRQARVTREVATRIADLSKELEVSGGDPEIVARFLMRCLFTMFAEDVGLLEGKPFSRFLEEYWLPHPKSFPGGIATLWRAMNEGGETLVGKMLRFNGGLFKDQSVLALSREAASGCSRKRRVRTGRRSTLRSSERFSSARWIPPNGIGSGRTTRRAPTSSGWSSRRSRSRYARTGTWSGRKCARWSKRGKEEAAQKKVVRVSSRALPRSGCSIRRAAPAISST